MLQIPHDQMMQLQASYSTFQHLLQAPLEFQDSLVEDAAKRSLDKDSDDDRD